jgi:hypothetical protein
MRLRQHRAASPLEFATPVKPVAAHPGEHRRQHSPVVEPRCRLQKMVDRRPTAPTARTVVEQAHDPIATLRQAKMTAPRRHEGPARRDNHAVGRLHDPQSRHPVESLGEAARELGRNVLHDEDRHRQIRGQQGDHGPQGLGTTGGRADHNGVEVSRLESRLEGPGRPLVRRRRCGHNRRPHAQPYGGQLLGKLPLDDFASDMQVEACRLEDEVEGTLHQGGDRRRRSLCGEAADHDRPWRQPTLLECP